jgi:hypothetical protein
MTKLFCAAAFAAGLAALAWVGAGYLAGHPLALAVIGLIAAFYVLGTWELLRFARATEALAGALSGLRQTPERLDDWLAPLPAALGSAVRQRIEGARTGLPGPVLAPYLSGLLVLLGMLGTFAGMVVALNGTGAALAGADGLAAIRDALSAPVQGLGLAFGTSVAGVAASAMLGLMTALCRRERIQAAQRLDAAMAAALRPFSSQHQRETSLRLLEQQAGLMPEVAGRIQACMEALERQQQALNERLTADQARFYRETESAYTALAASVERTLATSAADSAARAGAAIQPAIEAALAGLARQGADLHEGMAHQVRQQLDGLAAQFGDATATVSTQWTRALADHQRTSEATTQALGAALAQFTQGFEQRSAALAEGLAARLAQQSDALSARWGEALAQQARTGEQFAERHQQALQAAADGLAQHAAVLQGTVGQAHEGLQRRLAAQEEQRLARWTQSLEAVAATLRKEWQQAGAQTQAQQQQIGTALGQAARDIGTHTEAQATRLLAQIERRAAQDEQRLAAWAQSLQTQTAALREEWQQASAQATAQQQQVSSSLAQAAGDIARQMEAQAQGQLAEVGRLVQAASEAPRAAAEVIGELRQKLSDSMARDNAMLEERSRTLETLSTLLDAVNHASVEQRGAIDALVSASSELLERASGRFADTLEAQAARLDGVAAQITGSAVEVASLGEAFGGAVQLFGQSNEQMLAQLQRIEAAMAQSLARSDEQLDYYVAQAREVIELSVGAQKQIIDGLQQLAAQQREAA